MPIPTSFRNGLEVANAADSADDAFFIGDRDTNGSWKVYSNSGVYTIARRESGVWVDKTTISSSAAAVFDTVTAEGYTATDDGLVFGDATQEGAFRFVQDGTDLVMQKTVNTPPISWSEVISISDAGVVTIYELATSYITLWHKPSAPDDPSDDYSIMWVDSTTGDLLVKINNGGTTKTATIVDYSAV